MSRVNKSWMAVVAAILLVGILVGVVWARPHDGPQAQDITRKVTLAPADFVPVDDTTTWLNSGDMLSWSGGAFWFTAPVVFPCLPSVTVERIKLHVIDNSGTNSARALLIRTTPPAGKNVTLGEAKSPPGMSGGLKTYGSPDIGQVVWPSQKAYISLELPSNIYLWGVTVEYHRNI